MSGVDVEFLTCLLVNRLLKLADLLAEFVGEALEKRQVQQDACFFHVRQDRDEFDLDLTVEFLHAVRLQVGFLQRNHPQGHDRIGGSVGRCLSDRHLCHGDLALALADQVFDQGHFHPEPHPCQGFETQVTRIGRDQPLGDHRVEGDRADLDPHLAQSQQVILGVVGYFSNFGIRENWF